MAERVVKACDAPWSGVPGHSLRCFRDEGHDGDHYADAGGRPLGWAAIVPKPQRRGWLEQRLFERLKKFVGRESTDALIEDVVNETQAFCDEIFGAPTTCGHLVMGGRFLFGPRSLCVRRFGHPALCSDEDRDWWNVGFAGFERPCDIVLPDVKMVPGFPPARCRLPRWHEGDHCPLVIDMSAEMGLPPDIVSHVFIPSVQMGKSHLLDSFFPNSLGVPFTHERSLISAMAKPCGALIRFGGGEISCVLAAGHVGIHMPCVTPPFRMFPTLEEEAGYRAAIRAIECHPHCNLGCGAHCPHCGDPTYPCSEYGSACGQAEEPCPGCRRIAAWNFGFVGLGSIPGRVRWRLPIIGMELNLGFHGLDDRDAYTKASGEVVWIGNKWPMYVPVRPPRTVTPNLLPAGDKWKPFS